MSDKPQYAFERTAEELRALGFYAAADAKQKRDADWWDDQYTRSVNSQKQERMWFQ